MLTGQLQLNTKYIGVSLSNTTPYPVFRKSDMRVASMKLKQRALTGKPQCRRLTAQSSSLLQKRDLSSYRMENTKAETMEAIQQEWTFKSNVLKQVRSATHDCENLKQHGRQKFITALKYQNETIQRDANRPQSSHAHIERNGCKCLCRIEHNGPTIRGSILYGQRHATPNFYRQRPYSEPPIKYCQSKAMMHLPMDESLNNGKYESYVTTGYSAMSTMVKNGLHGGTTDIRLAKQRNSCASFLRSRTGTSLFDVPLISLSEDALSEHSEESDKDNEVMEEEEKVKRYDPAKPVSSLLRPLKAEDPPSTPTSPVPGGTAHRRRSSKNLKGPRCWVDDATVSSSKSEKDFCGNQSETKSNYSTQLSKGNPAAGGYCPKRRELHSVNLSAFETIEHDKTILRLPAYVCPSSEKKSRQIAIKEWLIKCNFTCANRNVPLL